MTSASTSELDAGVSPDPARRFRIGFSSILVLAIAAACLLHESLFTAKGLVSADGMLRDLPWSATIQHSPSNYLLADQFATLDPVRQFVADELRQGRFPLWNPYIACGLPNVAAIQFALLYPVNLLVARVGPFAGAEIAAFLKLLFSGIFMLVFMRGIGTSRAGAMAAAMAYMLSGFMVVWLGHPHTNAAVLFPLLLHFARGIAAERRLVRSAVGFAVAAGVMLLGGHPPTAIHIALVVGPYFLLCLAQVRFDAAAKRVAILAAAAIVGGMLAAPQLLPYLEYYRESSTPLATESLQRSSIVLTPVNLFHFVVPHFAGSPHTGFEELGDVLDLPMNENFSERTGYTGILVLFLAVLAVTRGPHRSTAFFGSVAAVSLLVVFGTWRLPELISMIPVLNAVNHQRLLLVVDLSAAVLAGLGLDHLLARGAARPRASAILFAVGAVFIIERLWVAAAPGLARLDAGVRDFLVREIGFAAVGLAVVLVVALLPLRSRAIAIIAVTWIAIDLLRVFIGFNPAIPRSLYYPSTTLTDGLKADPGTFRILPLSTVFRPNAAAVYGLQDVRGTDFTMLRRYEELITGKAGDFFFFEVANELPGAFELLNVRYVIAPEIRRPPDGFDLVYGREVAVYRARNPLERASIVFDHEVADRAAILSRVRSGKFDPRQKLLLEEPPPAEGGKGGEGRASIVVYEPDRVVVDAELTQPGFLLLLDNYYPGWRATANGRETPILRADYTFRAVALPAGRSRVEFTFVPASFRTGLMLAAIATATLAGVSLFDRRRFRMAPVT